jgi:hypothetical protein
MVSECSFQFLEYGIAQNVILLLLDKHGDMHMNLSMNSLFEGDLAI